MSTKQNRPFPPRSRSHPILRRVAAALSVLLVLPVLSTGSAAAGARATEDPTTIVDWNALAVTTIAADPTKKAPEIFLYMGFVQAAVHDAVVGIDGRYRPYLFHGQGRRGSSAQAASVAAAHEVLITTMASVSLRTISCFWSSVKTFSMTLTWMSGRSISFCPGLRPLRDA